MGNLKEDLKLAKNLLKDGKNNDVLCILEEHLNNGVLDYQLLCFSGLANSNVGFYEKAYELFKKAVKLDESLSIAWKGILKIFENESKTKPDEMVIKCCEKLKILTENREKIEDIDTTIRRISLELKDWERVLEYWCPNCKYLTNIVNILGNNDSFTDIELKIIKKAFSDLSSEGRIKSDYRLFTSYCLFLNKIQDNSLVENLVELIEKFEKIEEEWVHDVLFKDACENYFIYGDFPMYIEQISLASNISEIIGNLRASDSTSALENLDHLEMKNNYPESCLFVNLLFESENLLECEEIVESIKTSTNNDEVKKMCDGWIVKIALEEDRTIPIVDSLPMPQFLREQIRVFLIRDNKQGIEDILKVYPESTKEGIIARLVFSIHSDSVTENDAKLADLLLSMSGINWTDILLAAEIRHAIQIDVTSLLVKAAKLNPRSSRIFYLLGKCVGGKNPTKAKSCLERAVKIQPGKEEYVKEFDSLLAKQETPAEIRLGYLNKFVSSMKSKRKSIWLLESLSVLHLETNNLDMAIELLQQIVRLRNDDKLAWARLASAYFKKGHLRAAINSYEQLAMIEGGQEYTIPMIRVLIHLRKFETALVKVEEFRKSTENMELSEGGLITIDCFEAQIRLSMINSTNGEIRKEHIRKSLFCLCRCIKMQTNFSMAYKLAGDALMEVAQYAERIFPQFEIDPSWRITDLQTCIKSATLFYSIVVRLRKNDPFAWYDLSVAMLRRFKIEKQNDHIVKVKTMIKHAIGLTKDESLLSSMWTLLAEALRLENSPSYHQLHCLTRALQLNKTNDSAWLHLGVLSILQSEMNVANQALEQAIKYNPHNGDAWCAWAQHAHLQQSGYDAMMMFRLTLCNKPTPYGIIGYCGYLCDSLRKETSRYDSANSAIEFEPMIDFIEMACSDSDTLYHLGILADLFGFYKEALECFELAKCDQEEIERIRMKLSVFSEKDCYEKSTCRSSNTRLGGLISLDVSGLHDMLMSEMSTYSSLFRFMEENDIESFRKMYVDNIKVISVPLVVSAIIALDLKISMDIVGVIREALPRHELIDYFPTVLPEGMDNGLRHLEQDGEVPFRYRNHVAQDVYDELKRLREEYEERSKEESSESNVIVS